MRNRRLVATSDDEDEPPRPPWQRSRAASNSEEKEPNRKKRKMMKLPEEEEEEVEGGKEEKGESERDDGKENSRSGDGGEGPEEEEEVPQEDAKPVGELVRVSGKGWKRLTHYEAFEFDGNRYDPRMEQAVILLQQQLQKEEEVLAQQQKTVDQFKQSIAMFESMIIKPQQQVPQISQSVTTIPSDLNKIKQMVSTAVADKKSYYVIFNGPMKGIYDDWYKAVPFIQNQPVTHKKFSTMEEAQKALGESNNTIGSFAETIKQPRRFRGESSGKQIVLGKIPKIPTIDQIDSPEHRAYIQQTTLEKFQNHFTILTSYNDSHRCLHYYPKYRNQIGIKAVVLPQASPVATIELFKAGLITSIYLNNTEPLKYFPPNLKSIIQGYIDRFAKGRQIFLNIYNTYALYNNSGQEEVPNYSVIQLGVSNGGYPDMVRDPAEHLTEEEKEFQIANSFTGIIMQLQRLNINIRINYKSDTCLIYSRSSSEISEEQEKTFLAFKDIFIKNQVPHLSENIKRIICEKISTIKGHYCQYCPYADTEMNQQEEKKEFTGDPYDSNDLLNSQEGEETT